MHPAPRILIALILIALTSQVRGELRFQSTMQQVALIELFTSEGCSSCPPAEKWMGELTHEKGLWTSFVPVAFHVDYWDQLGWRDSFATRQATQRQYEYAKHWGNGSVYTPCFVRNGDEWRRDNTNLAGPVSAEAGVLTAKLSDNHVWEIEYKPTTHVAEGLDVTVALLGSGIVSSIRSGENAGRELRHDFSVLAFSKVAMNATSEGRFGALITLPPETDVQYASSRAIAVWIVKHGTVVPIQATGGWLTESNKQSL
jgi:hypothetical protein